MFIVLQITTESLNRVNREQLKLTSNLSIKRNNHIYDLSENDKFDVKLEVPKAIVSDNYLIEVGCIKQEDFIYDEGEANCDDFPLASVSSDDEPLALCKSEKERKKSDKRREKKGKKIKDAIVEEANMDNSDDLQEIEVRCQEDRSTNSNMRHVKLLRRT